MVVMLREGTLYGSAPEQQEGRVFGGWGRGEYSTYLKIFFNDASVACDQYVKKVTQCVK